MRGEQLWQTLIKDIVLTGTGVAVIVFQTFSPHPSPELLTTALILCGLSAAGHVKALASRRIESRSSSQQSVPSSPSSSSLPRESDNQA